MRLAETLYETAAGLYETNGSQAHAKRARARALFTAFWIKEDPMERRDIIGRCISLASDASQGFESRDDKGSLAETHYDILTYRKEALSFPTDRTTLVNLFNETLETGWKVIDEFEKLGESELHLESLNTMVWLYELADEILGQPEYLELEKKIERLNQQVPQLSKTATPYAISLRDELTAWLAMDLEGDALKALKLFEMAASGAEALKDSYTIGRLFTALSGVLRWVALGEEYVEKRRELLQKALSLASSAIRNLEISSHGNWLKLAYGRYAEAQTYLALSVETDVDKKRSLLREAVQTAKGGMTYENHGWQAGVGHELSKAMYFLARMGVGPSDKAQLLKEALPIREEVVRIHEVLSPHSWARGVMLNYLALVKAEVSESEQDTARKAGLLRSAILDMEKCVELCTGWVADQMIPPGRMRALAQYVEWYGDALFQLYRLVPEPEKIKLAVKAYEDAIEHLAESETLAPVGAVRWKIAQVNDTIGDYMEASRSFSKAGEDYRLAVERTPALGSAFEELALYMDAWAQIEEARFNHDEEQYSLASGNYTKAATTLKKTRSWRHLSNHYGACSLLEQAEMLSRDRAEGDSIKSFHSAKAAFEEARKELRNKLDEAPAEEKKALKDWLDITGRREKYCLGRTQLEEAKLLDREGEEEPSGAKYRSAARVFEALLSKDSDEQTRRELQMLVFSCEAWTKMKEAEVTASPQLYSEAAEFFAKVEEIAPRKRFRLLALADASMCRALESGTRFRRTRDVHLYSEIKRRLETAADYYQEAGFDKAADWTRATQRLFDALVYMADAEIKRDRKKKTELYHLAEKHLEMAAKLYQEAGFPSKNREVLRHLTRVREEKELLLTPVEALAENPAVTEVSVAPVSLKRDKAIGLERFEMANVVGSLWVSHKELHVGSDLTLELEMANVGKTAATLIRLENVAPRGFDLDRQKTTYPTENGSIDMRGRRLEHLKTHEVKIGLKALRKGTFELRPRILFVDEKGNQGTFEMEPAAITVRELGITGWIKGPSR